MVGGCSSLFRVPWTSLVDGLNQQGALNPWCLISIPESPLGSMTPPPLRGFACCQTRLARRALPVIRRGEPGRDGPWFPSLQGLRQPLCKLMHQPTLLPALLQLSHLHLNSSTTNQLCHTEILLEELFHQKLQQPSQLHRLLSLLSHQSMLIP